MKRFIIKLQTWWHSSFLKFPRTSINHRSGFLQIKLVKNEFRNIKLDCNKYENTIHLNN